MVQAPRARDPSLRPSGSRAGTAPAGSGSPGLGAPPDPQGGPGSGHQCLQPCEQSRAKPTSPRLARLPGQGQRCQAHCTHVNPDGTTRTPQTGPRAHTAPAPPWPQQPGWVFNCPLVNCTLIPGGFSFLGKGLSVWGQSPGSGRALDLPLLSFPGTPVFGAHVLTGQSGCKIPEWEDPGDCVGRWQPCGCRWPFKISQP